MAFDFKNLDAVTRKQMVSEIDLDVSQGKLYLSKHFKDDVADQYESLIREAAESHDETWLANEIRKLGLLKTRTMAKHPKKDTMIEKAVPVTAADTFAEGEFNRFYARGLCQRAVAEGIPEVEVYRAKQVMNARSASEEMIGKRLEARALLADLRTSLGVDTALQLPPGPNSGLSVFLP